MNKDHHLVNFDKYHKKICTTEIYTSNAVKIDHFILNDIPHCTLHIKMTKPSIKSQERFQEMVFNGFDGGNQGS